LTKGSEPGISLPTLHSFPSFLSKPGAPYLARSSMRIAIIDDKPGLKKPVIPAAEFLKMASYLVYPSPP